MLIRFILILQFTLFSTQLCGQDYFFRKYGPDYGLNNSFIYALNQTSDGYLWVGTAEGLYRFNGFEFQHFTEKEGLAESFVTSIYKDFSGGLWIGHMSGGITQISNNNFNIISETSTNNSSITSITETERGTIWCSTQNDGLLVIYPNKRIVKLTAPYEDELINTFQNISGNLFLLGTQENLYIIRYSEDSGSFSEKVRVSSYPFSGAVDIIKDSNGDFIIVSRDEGVFRLTINDESLFYKLEEISNNNNGDLDNAHGALFISTNELLVNTMGTGIIKFNREDESGKLVPSAEINTKSGLLSDNIRCLFKDMEGNIWLGTYGNGLLRLVDENLKFYSFENTILTNRIFSLSADSEFIWVSSDKSISKISPDDGVIRKSYALPVKLKEDKINSIYCSYEGVLYLGFEKSGVFTFNPKSESFSKLFISLDNLENSVNYISGKGENIWIGTKKGVCKLNSISGALKWFKTVDGLPHNNIYHIFIDSNDRALIGTTCNNIFFIDVNNKVDTLPFSGNMGHNTVISIGEDKNGSIWAATNGNGVFKVSNDGVRNFSQATGLLSDYCYGLLFDGNQNIVVSHRGGFSTFLGESNRIKIYNQYDGITSSSEFFLNEVVTDHLNNIWFGTSIGLIKYGSEPLNRVLPKPILHIEAVYLNKKKINFYESIEVQSGFYEIEVEYIAINLRNPEKVSYQTTLEGYSNHWSEINDNRRSVYEKVGSGEYTFRIMAFDENGVSIDTPLPLAITINKPFYITWWFILIAISIVVVLVAAYIKVREQTLIREKTILEGKVQERTDEVVQKSKIIEEKNLDITASIRYAERIQRAMLPNISSINETFVLFMPKDIVSGDFYWMYDNGETTFLAAVDCTGHGVPGAFMSIIGHNSLNKVVREYGITKPSAILDRLNQEVNREILQCNEIGIKDGMDIALITFNRKKFTLEFAGAFNPLYVINDGDLMIYKGDRFSIGMYSLEQELKFTNNIVNIQPNDMIYLFTDGYSDQFGHLSGKKFKSVNLRRILSEIWNLPCGEQKILLEKEIETWKGNLPQVDDILLIGSRIPDE